MQPSRDTMALMPDYSSFNCSVADTAQIIGERWSLLILRDAFYGVRRFDDFQKDLGIARNILSDRLAKLMAHGIMETRRYQEHPPRNEYRLTEKGKDLFDVLVALMTWGERWGAAEDPQVLIHNDCGSHTQLVATCSNCGEHIHRRNVRVEPMLPIVVERILERAEASS